LKENPYTNTIETVVDIMSEPRRSFKEYRMDVAMGFITRDHYHGV